MLLEIQKERSHVHEVQLPVEQGPPGGCFIVYSELNYDNIPIASSEQEIKHTLGKRCLIDSSQLQ